MTQEMAYSMENSKRRKPGSYPEARNPMDELDYTQPEEPAAGLLETEEEPEEDEVIIGPEDVEKATERLLRYQCGKAMLDERIVANEEWWKRRHWSEINARFGLQSGEQEEPASAWLVNSVMNKHADAMDSFPEVATLPREENDVELADTLSSVLPVILEENHYEAVYDDKWWYKLKQGTGVEMVYWDKTKHNGLGDVGICTVDLLRLVWEPGVRNIQKSDDVFCLDVMTLEQFESRYPEYADEVKGGTSITVRDYHHADPRDTSEQIVVVDWYYKRITPEKRTLLHMCKYVGNTILFASENQKKYRDRGLYDHGLYPFVLDPLYPVQDSCAGIGCIDIMRDPQMYIDQLDSLILRNAKQTGRKRFMLADGSGVNEDELLDWNKEIVHVAGSMNDLMFRELTVDALNQKVYDVRREKIDELKETSGNRDFNQGGTTSGVTAASAIAALQESGNKLSRDMIKASYRAYGELCEMVIELIRQFYTTPRTYRITGKDGGMAFVSLDNSELLAESLDEYGVKTIRKPVFDLKIRAQRANPFSQLSQNELGVQLYQMGVFNPQMADQAVMMLDMMQFEGVDKLKQQIQQRGTLFEQMQQQIAMLTDALNRITGGMMQPAAQPAASPAPDAAPAAQNPLAQAAHDAQAVNGSTAAMRTARRGAV